MKTEIASAPITSHITRLHWLLSVVGIATAIICSFVLLGDFQPKPVEPAQSILIKMPTSSISQGLENLGEVVGVMMSKL
jgi:hypothetical protein